MRIVQISNGNILQGKKILITGGSAGIGLAIARKCLKEGAAVVITGRNKMRMDAALRDLNSPNVSGLIWDVGEIGMLEEKLSRVSDLLGGFPDVLVNNAGMLIRKGFYGVDERIWDETYAVNSKAVFFLCQAMAREWKNSTKLQKILNIASSGSVLGATYPYRMTKWDVAGLTEGLGRLLSPCGIIVNGIAPGRTATAMLNREGENNYYDDKQPVERLGLPEEIAELAVFLISDATNYIVGQTIFCDGGYTLRS